MSKTHEIERLAEELLDVYSTKQPVAPLRDRFPGMTVEDAYRIQQVQEERFEAAGRKVVGRKIGLTSLAMQRQLGVDSPDFGFITEDMIHHDGDTIPADQFIAPKVEPEFGFLLRKDLTGPGVSLEDAIDAIGSIHAAIEIIDSRIADWNIRLVDTVADNASCGAIAVSADPLPITVDDLVSTACTLRIDGEEAGSGTGADVMSHPAQPLAWLANVLGDNGIVLRAGQWVLPGSFCAAQTVRAGSSATADFGELGALTISF